jgi:hypothetical protein
MTTPHTAAPEDATSTPAPPRELTPRAGELPGATAEALERPGGEGVEAAPQVRRNGARPGSQSIESVLTKRWARILIPSLSDLFFLAILVWLFLSGGSAGWQGLLADADVGWHIRTGDYILDHHAVPRQDLYSFSKPGAPWYAWEWLTDVSDSALHRVAGLKGIVLAAAVIIALFATTLMRRMVWRGVHLLVGLAVALLGVGAASIHFLARPHIYTLLFLSVSVWLIEADRDPRGASARKRIWWLVPFAALWTNVHGGFLALIAVLGLTAVGIGIETLLKMRTEAANWGNFWRYVVLTGACSAATLINPYGWRLHQHVLEYLRSDWIRNVIQEFQSPSFRTENMLQFEILLLIGLMAAAGLFRRLKIVEGLWIVFWAHMALGSARHVPVFITVATPAIAIEVAGWWNGWTARAGKASLAGIVNQIAADTLPGFRRTSAWPFLAIAALILIGAPPAASQIGALPAPSQTGPPPAPSQTAQTSSASATPMLAIRWPQDFPELLFPTKMVHEHADLITASKVLTTDQWGDYLIYTDPRRKVFVDGRSDFYGPEVGDQYLGLINGRWDWQKILAKYDFNLALVPTETAIAQLLKLSPDWRVVEDDGKHILLVRGSTSVPPQGDFRTEPRF